MINGSEPLNQSTVTTLERYSCRTLTVKCLISVLLNKQPCRWSRQSKVSALLFLLHIRRGAVSMVRCHGFPWVTALFLTRQGHWELSFRGRRQHTHNARTSAHTQRHNSHYQFPLCLPLFNTETDAHEATPLIKNKPLCLSLLMHRHLCPSKALIKMEPLD